MEGNPTVKVNEVFGDNSNSGLSEGSYDHEVPTYFDANGNFKGWTIDFRDDANNPSTVTSSVKVFEHEKGKLGVIGTIFGGGNAARVDGQTNVSVCTEKTIDYVSTARGESAPRTNLSVHGADIRGNVFGGGNAADVTGNTNVTIGK